VTFKVLDEHLVDAFRIGRIAASVAHGTASTVQVLPHDHGHLPHSRVGLGRAGRDHAVVEDLVVERVRPRRRLVLVDGHRRVVSEVHVVEHLEHAVTTHLIKSKHFLKIEINLKLIRVKLINLNFIKLKIMH
jgi:hypothetical protein